MCHTGQVWLCHAVFHVVQVWLWVMFNRCDCGCVMLCFMYRCGCVMLNRRDWLCHTVCFDVQV